MRYILWVQEIIIRNIWEEEDSAILNDNPYLQIGTGYSQYDIHQNLSYMQNSFYPTIWIYCNIQILLIIPRYDRLTDPGSGTLLEIRRMVLWTSVSGFGSIWFEFFTKEILGLMLCDAPKSQIPAIAGE